MKKFWYTPEQYNTLWHFFSASLNELFTSNTTILQVAKMENAKKLSKNILLILKYIFIKYGTRKKIRDILIQYLN